MSTVYGPILEAALRDLDINVHRTEERFFPEERWLILFVDQASLAAAQLSAGDIERQLNASIDGDGAEYAVTFRPHVSAEEVSSAKDEEASKSRLMGHQVDQLVKLLEARSRTSDALPSLRYVEDPRASLAAATATRHQIVYGRRGVGKTALLVESKRLAEQDGHITAWINAQVLKGFEAPEGFLFLTEAILEAIVRQVGSSTAPIVTELRDRLQAVRELRSSEEVSSRNVSTLVAELNGELRRVLRHDLHQLVVYIDDFYLYSAHLQAELLDLLARLLRDCNGWIKLASIERLTRPYEPSTRVGLEVPHDATKD
jgi:hypothetical protein